MRYDLCTSDNTDKIGDIILNELPKVSTILHFSQANWRVTGIKWSQDVNNNDVSSGLICVERIISND
jgi:hypothetical protein